MRHVFFFLLIPDIGSSSRAPRGNSYSLICLRQKEWRIAYGGTVRGNWLETCKSENLNAKKYGLKLPGIWYVRVWAVDRYHPTKFCLFCNESHAREPW